MRTSWLAASLVLALAACGPTTETIQLSVINQSPSPMTVVLTKDGPPMEKNWLPPEDIAMMKNAPADMTVNGITLQPKQKVDQVRIGQFEAGVHPMLRIYRGDQNMKQMLGIGPDSPNRSDLVLHPGHNTIVIDPTGTPIAK